MGVLGDATESPSWSRHRVLAELFPCCGDAIPMALCRVVCYRMLGSDVIPLPHIYGARIKGIEVFCPLDLPPPYEAVVNQIGSEQVWFVGASKCHMSSVCPLPRVRLAAHLDSFFPIGCHGRKLPEHGGRSRVCSRALS